MSTNEAPPDREERLKSALWYSIGQYIDDQLLSSSTSTSTSTSATLNATPQFIGALTELVYTQIANTARDLETFAQHAGRRAIGTEDVMLLARRNDALEGMLRGELERLRGGGEGGGSGNAGGGGGGGGKKRGRPSGGGRGRGGKKGKGKERA